MMCFCYFVHPLYLVISHKPTRQTFKPEHLRKCCQGQVIWILFFSLTLKNWMNLCKDWPRQQTNLLNVRTELINNKSEPEIDVTEVGWSWQWPFSVVTFSFLYKLKLCYWNPVCLCVPTALWGFAQRLKSKPCPVHAAARGPSHRVRSTPISR